jgi:hypothetical protein
MNKRFLMIASALGMLLFSSIACEFSATTAKISSAVLTADAAGKTATTVFTTDQPFVYVVDLANAPDDTKVKAVWYSVDAAGAATQFVDKEIVGGKSPITFSATNSGPWPVGKYKVELYLNDKLDRTAEFSVQ